MENKYPSDWDSRRQAVYERDNYTCQNCGQNAQDKTSLDLHAHHIVPISKGGTHSKTNLSSMCSDCHNAIHHNKKAPTAKGNLQSIERLSNYQDVVDLYPKIPGLFEKSEVYLSAHEDENGPETVIHHYKESRKQFREGIYEYKRKLSSFDPYDNVESDNVQSDFKNVFNDGMELFIELLNEGLELDRVMQKYIKELTSVECSECGKMHPESTKFCGDCGTELPVLSICSECGKVREKINQNFCQNCGTELNTYPQTRLSKIEITEQKLEELTQSCNSKVMEAAEFIKEDVDPLWERN